MCVYGVPCGEASLQATLATEELERFSVESSSDNRFFITIFIMYINTQINTFACRLRYDFHFLKFRTSIKNRENRIMTTC